MAKIVILGAGYGGMAAAVELEQAGLPFTLVNKHEYHYFTTLLHEPAGGRNEFEQYYVNLHDVLRRESSTVQLDVVKELRPKENKVLTERGELTYDYAVVALGNAPEFFGIPGMKEHALLLRSLETARQIHDHVERAFATYHEDRDESKLRVLVGGAGLTGVELCGELAEWLPELAGRYGVPFSKVELVNIEAAPTILPMLSDELRAAAESALQKKGVKLLTGVAITKVLRDQVELKTGEVIDAKTIIWTGGVRANPLLAAAGLQTDPRGRAVVNAYLQAVEHANVFVIGDSASFPGEDGRPLPPTGQAATQMGDHAAKNLANLLHGRALEPFRFVNLGTLASIGHEFGVGSVKGLHAVGVSASLMKEASKVKYLWSLGGLRMVSLKRGQLKRKGS
ncbi:NADH dehydrogenase [Tumebacillus sp. BK434]|uniref:NAD(P)/FAD-dependent oxidoreductase n=1 Tax=Tumebacillus sp. BK434 TaxID=2512169 RepID=UPI00104FAE40|nr:NAD(P)/FAD-dependent oxidoreductase [Tumebacillus sp. BK434]TCP53289.1 NADH dehydrogenase [Tumebacillus sp. BK434]